MVELIPLGTAEVASADFAVAAGSSAGLLLKDGSSADSVASGAIALIQVRSSAGKYTTVGTLDSNNPLRVLAAPGTYRILKRASPAVPGIAPVPFGIDKD